MDAVKENDFQKTLCAQPYLQICLGFPPEYGPPEHYVENIVIRNTRNFFPPRSVSSTMVTINRP
jgi:hypothetical protein